jgi:hypothetical protein
MSSRTAGARGRVWVLALGVCAVAAAPWAAEARRGQPGGAERQMETMLRLFTFDRNLVALSDGAIRIGVVFNSEDEQSMLEFEQVGAWLAGRLSKKVAGLPLTFIGVDSAMDDLDAVAQQLRLNVLYVCEGNDGALEAVKAVSRSRRILTVTAVEPYVQRGITVGLRSASVEGPALTLDRQAAVEEGRRFDAKDLQRAGWMR